MLGRLIILAAVGIGLLWFWQWRRRTPPGQVAKILRRTALYGTIGVVILLALTGRLNPVFAAIAAAVPLVIRGLSLLQMLPAIQQLLRRLGIRGIPGATAGGHPGSTAGASSLHTRFLAMTLDHESGRMDGVVLEGDYQGRRLSELNLESLLDLLATCRAGDPQSAAVLEAYLDRVHGETWREQATAGKESAAQPGQRRMTRQEALAILGLPAGARAEEIRAAHRRLMQKFHPDRGGSNYLAATINEAKRVLLGD